MLLCPLCSPDPSARACSREPAGAQEALFILAFTLSWRSFLNASWQLILWVRCDALLGMQRASADPLTRLIFNLDNVTWPCWLSPSLGPQAMLTVVFPPPSLPLTPTERERAGYQSPQRSPLPSWRNHAARSTMGQQVPPEASVTHL